MTAVPKDEGRPAAGRGPRPVLRVLVIWLSTSLALWILASVLPGLDVEDIGTALAAALLLGLLNASVWPLIIRLAMPLTVLTLGLFPLLLNGLIIGLNAYLLPGFAVQDLATGVLTALGITAANTTVTGVLAIDDDDIYLRRVARLARKESPGAATDVPGVLFLQIDGLGQAVLKRAIRDGNAPTLAAWISAGSHRLVGWETDWSSQTGASQAGILLGSNDDIPAFRWMEKDTGQLMVSNHPRAAAQIECRRSTGAGLLHADGASRNNIFTGDTADAVLTMSVVVGRDRGKGRKGRIGRGYQAYFAHPYNTTRTLLAAIGEIVREWQQAAVQRRRDIRPRVHRGGVYPLLRTFTTVISRDVTVATLVGDMMAGRSVIYADFLGYDEVAHHSGVERYDALDTLRRIDREFARLARVAEMAPRPYRIVVLSDHGQSQGATFRDRCGETLGELVQRAMGPAPVVTDRTGQTAPGEESWGYAAGAVEEASAGTGVVAAALRKLSARRRTSGEVLLGPDRADAAQPINESDVDAVTTKDEAVVLGSGNLGLVYLMNATHRMTLEQIDTRYPELVPTLVDHPGIGFLLVRTQQHGPVVLGRDGARFLTTGEVRGTDPLAPFGPSAVRQVLRTDGFAHCPDLTVNSMWDPQTDEVAAFEELVGSHGGLGGEQTRPFILFPADLPAPDSPVHGAEQVHQLFRMWLAQLGHSSYGEIQALPTAPPAERHDGEPR
ncbi:MAG TPA: phage holin family protein [Jiangellaceae bacterium]